MRDGEPWFVTADVCRVLGIINSHNVIRRLDDDEKSKALIYANGGFQTLNTVNESGLYTLIFGSSKKEAKAFRRWVTHDILPSMRRYGLYTVDEVLANPDSPINVLKEFKAKRELDKLLCKEL